MKLDDKYQINGRIIDTKSSRGIGGLRVEAWDKDLLFDDLVGSSKTDADGRFRIEFTSSYFQELFLDRRPDLFFKIFADGELIKSTQDSVMWNVSSSSIPVEIAVPWTRSDPTPDGAGADYVVNGRVTSPDRPAWAACGCRSSTRM